MAKELGNIAFLLPEGASSVLDAPADLVRAIQFSTRVLAWQEDLLEEEMPPKWMWLYEDELTPWFEEVMRNRKAKFSTDTPSSGEGEMVENEFAKGRR